MSRWIWIVVGFLLGFGSMANADELRVQGTGATFPAPLYQRWLTQYQKSHPNILIDYQSIGSLGGIKALHDRTVDFGATDVPLAAEKLEKEDWMQWPTVAGGIVIAVNLPQLGEKTNSLHLTGPIVADIYLGKITHWNDPAIRAINPDLSMPDLAITPIWRTDASGTTFVFTHYLSAVSPPFNQKVGAGAQVRWPVGQGGKGGNSPSVIVKYAPGGITYVESAFAHANQLACPLLQNHDGRFVACTPQSIASAMSNAHWTKPDDFNKSLVNMPGRDSWPITAATFILLPRKPADKKKAEAVVHFFDECLSDPAYAKQATELGYAPLPANLLPIVRQQWKP